MSINAMVEFMVHNEDGFGALHLRRGEQTVAIQTGIDRPMPGVGAGDPRTDRRA
jgi:hypothetical protein